MNLSVLGCKKETAGYIAYYFQFCQVGSKDINRSAIFWHHSNGIFPLSRQSHRSSVSFLEVWLFFYGHQFTPLANSLMKGTLGVFSFNTNQWDDRLSFCVCQCG
jgi:hypothetical protein